MGVVSEWVTMYAGKTNSIVLSHKLAVLFREMKDGLSNAMNNTWNDIL
jgi:hypothetical protein